MPRSLGVDPRSRPDVPRLQGMERFVVAGGARLAGEVRVTGAKNSVLKLMAATLLAEGTSRLTAVPDILDVTIMGELLSRLGCTVVRDAGAVDITVPAAGVRGRLRPGPADARLHRGARPAGGPLRSGEGRAARWGRDRLTRPGHARRRPDPAGCHRRERARVPARAPATGCAEPVSGWTSRASARPRTCSWRRCWPRASRRSTTRPASPTSSTCARSCRRWAPRSAGSGRAPWRSRGWPACDPPSTGPCRTGSSPAPGPSRRR